MNSNELAKKLKQYIQHGDVKKVQDLLNPVTDQGLLRDIEAQFIKANPKTDPVNLAIDCREEKIAIYLVEKAFSTNKIYQWPDQKCDQWCYYDHGPDRCPSEYEAVDNAADKNLYKLRNLIEAIRHGKKKAGDGLTALITQPPTHIPQPPPSDENKPKTERPAPAVVKKERTPGDEARDVLEKYGKNYVSKEGNTLLHMSVDKPTVYVYVLAKAGVPVNVQNYDGDTALHLAVRKKQLDVIIALVHCSADLSVRNKMGQTPIDESEGKTKVILQKFEPGVVAAVCEGRHRAVDRMVKTMWCSTDTVIKEGKTVIELAESKSDTNENVKNCVRILKEYRKTAELIHAVLCEDVSSAKKILRTQKGWSINVRFRDRLGKTLLCQAIESNNLEMVKLLVDNGARFQQIRVRESETTDVTVPLFFRALRRNLNPDIPKFLNTLDNNSDSMFSEHNEKDCNGNTAILRAIEEGQSAKFISWLVQTQLGANLADRNQSGLTPRELAELRNRDDIVKVIDRYIVQKMSRTVIANFAVKFYRQDHLQVKDEQSGKSLQEVLEEEDQNKEVKRWSQYKDIETHAINLFEAAASGDIEEIKTLDGMFQDRNGYTVLIRAIVFMQYDIINQICTTHPALKTTPDISNRYPLHYAYALPEQQATPFVRLLLERNPEDSEKCMDKDGRVPADYADLRHTVEIQKMLYDARTLDSYGKRGPPLGPWPDGANRFPPDVDEI